MCMDNGNSSSPGTPITLQPCTGGSSQSWGVLKNVAQGTFKLISSSGLCLDANSGQYSPGGWMDQALESCSGAASQQWMINSTPDGNWNIIEQSQQNCMDIDGSQGYFPGINDITYPCSGGQDQEYQLTVY